MLEDTNSLDGAQLYMYLNYKTDAIQETGIETSSCWH